MFDADDRRHMDAALALAREGLGLVWPNPSVGCVIVNRSEVVGIGRTGDGGRPHAEMVAVEEAGARARGATAYVTLEPCSHWGHTPPCCEILAEAAVRRAIVAVRDPDPRVNGKGIAWLEERGIAVTEGLHRDAAARVNAGFFRRVSSGRPWVAVSALGGGTLHGEVPKWDALAAHEAFVGHARPLVGFALEGLASRFSGVAAWWLLHEGDVRGSGRIVRVPRGHRHHAPAHAALAALGEVGLTRLLVHADDPVAEALSAAGLVDERLSG